MAAHPPHTQPILVVGHQRPDTDSAVSAAVYADLLNLLNHTQGYHEGVMLGEPTAQTRWLFTEANVRLPRVISHTHLLVRDVAKQNVISINSNAALGDALELIQRHHIGMVPVLNEQKQLIGMLSDHMPMASYFYHANAEDFLGVLFSTSDIERYLKLDCWQPAESEAIGQIVLDLSRLTPGAMALLGDDPKKLLECRDAGATAAIVCTSEKNTAWDEAIRECPKLGIFQYNGSLMALVTQLPMAIPASRLMQTENLPTLEQDQTVEEAQTSLLEAQFALPVMNSDGTLYGVVSRAEILGAPRRRVVLVDHFERHQAPEGIAAAEIIEIIDHHRVGSLETNQPIRVDCRPVGSTATIIACKFAENGQTPTLSQAKLLLGAIMADTLLLTSPTTTPVDRHQADLLASIAQVDLHQFGREVLVKNDETLDQPASVLLENDLKEFSVGEMKFAVSQIETVDRSRLTEAHLESFFNALSERRKSAGWNFAALLITDIFRSDSLVYFDAQAKTVMQKLGPSGTVWTGCVSRKKQFLPEILKRIGHR